MAPPFFGVVFLEALVLQLSMLSYNYRHISIALFFITLHRCFIFYKWNASLSASKDNDLLYCITHFIMVVWKKITSISLRYALGRYFILLLFCFLFNTTFGQPKDSSLSSGTRVAWRVDLGPQNLFGKEVNNGDLYSREMNCRKLDVKQLLRIHKDFYFCFC